MLEAATTPMLRARVSLRQELAVLEKKVRHLAQEDPVCNRLMTTPGIGAVVALTTDRSMYPKDLSQRPCENAGRTRRQNQKPALAEQVACAKWLDWDGPITEVQTLINAHPFSHKYSFDTGHIDDDGGILVFSSGRYRQIQQMLKGTPG
ncbi:hypothetical protein [Roseovarius sp.]|uniref:hypothetical protein n=1 Tax=Roseovarius sp. TaxID=1486281 RepID=UPI0035679D02